MERLSYWQVPSHLHHMLFELVKNSLRAVQERFEDTDSEPPPIRVVVADGLEDVTIKVRSTRLPVSP
jgi:pyruvate dehydrogenase kinase 2/3/4